MGVKVEVEKYVIKPEKYPVLKIWGNDLSLVVLFTAPEEGVVEAPDKTGRWSIGERYDDWAEEEFHVFHGEVRKSNEY